MGTVHHLPDRRVVDQTLIYTLGRVIIGLVLLLKGIYFISNTEVLQNLIMQSQFSNIVNVLVSFITFAHIIGGAFIVLGLLTRVAVLLQIPILAGALFFNLSQQAFGTGIELILSIIVFIGLVYYFLKGSGRISMDDYLERKLL